MTSPSRFLPLQRREKKKKKQQRKKKLEKHKKRQEERLSRCSVPPMRYKESWIASTSRFLLCRFGRKKEEGGGSPFSEKSDPLLPVWHRCFSLFVY